jgi:hypothetical protein
MVTLPSTLESLVAANRTTYQSTLKDNTIRIVELHPAPGDDPVVCLLAIAELKDSDGTFEALSYCWGKEPANDSIICDGSPFQPTKNLHEALVQMRHSAESRFMWIDAVSLRGMFADL